MKLGFYFRNKFCFSLNVRKRFVSATFLPLLDCGDLVYQFVPSYLLSSLDAVYHSALRFISDCKPLTHHCTLYNRVAWPSLSIIRKMHCYLIILGLLPSYRVSYSTQKCWEIFPPVSKLFNLSELHWKKGLLCMQLHLN